MKELLLALLLAVALSACNGGAPPAPSQPLKLTSPTGTVSGTAQITAEVSGAVGWINVYVDNVYYNSSPPYTFPWDTRTVRNGPHTVRATAYSTAGAEIGEDSESVTVANSLTGGLPTPTPPATALTGFFVSTAGNDSNSGTDEAHPWSSLRKVSGHTFGADDHVYFRCQDKWTGQTLELSNEHGTAGHPIVYDGMTWGACVPPANTPADHVPGNVEIANLDGGSSAKVAIHAYFSPLTNVTVRGFNIFDYTKGGILFLTNGGMTGIIIEHNMVHQTGPGACANCGSPHDDGDYDSNAAISFADYKQSADCVQIKNNDAWDGGGHNTMRVHYDTCSTLLVAGNYVGPGCLHNCIDTKGINGLVLDNVTTCEQGSKRGEQCHNTGTNDDAGFYSENGYVAAGTHPTWQGNIAVNVPRGFQVAHEPGFAIGAKLYNNTTYGTSALDNAIDLSMATAPDVRKNIVFQGKVSMGGGGTWDYNDVYLSSGAPSGPNDITTNPDFAEPPANLHPTNPTVKIGAKACSVTGFSYFGALD